MLAVQLTAAADKRTLASSACTKESLVKPSVLQCNDVVHQSLMSDMFVLRIRKTGNTQQHDFANANSVSAIRQVHATHHLRGIPIHATRKQNLRSIQSRFYDAISMRARDTQTIPILGEVVRTLTTAWIRVSLQAVKSSVFLSKSTIQLSAKPLVNYAFVPCWSALVVDACRVDKHSTKSCCANLKRSSTLGSPPQRSV